MTNGTGINIKDSEDTVIGNNTITNNDVTGDVIDVDGSTGTDIGGNTFDGNNVTDGNLIDVEGSKDTTVKDNTIKNNTIPSDGEIIKVENSTGTDVEDNTYVDNVPSIDVDDVVVDDLVINLPKDATGNVTVNIGGKTITVPVRDGKAVIPMDNIAAGEYPVVIVYSGDDKYAPSNMTDVVDIIGGIIINASDIVKYYHGPERFVVTITDYAGNPVDGKSVNITINGVTYYRITENGTASLAINLNSGIYNTTVDIEGNGTRYATVTVLPTVNATDLVKVFRNGTQFWATFYDSEGNYLPEGTAVTFNINGVTYTRYVSGDKGLAKLNINLPQGSYIITAINPVTGEKASNNVTVIPLIVENNDLVKYYRNASQFVVKVIDSTGKAAPGLTVTYDVNGVFYYRTTDADGYARLNINLPPGDYVITTEYGGCRVANNIKVLPVLTASDMVKKQGSPDQFVATLVDGQGRPYANQVVSFNINGVLYNRLTDSDGKAKLNINLPAGEYIITSSFNGSNIANKITITP